jgi:hypothetical protein
MATSQDVYDHTGVRIGTRNAAGDAVDHTGVRIGTADMSGAGYPAPGPLPVGPPGPHRGRRAPAASTRCPLPSHAGVEDRGAPQRSLPEVSRRQGP